MARAASKFRAARAVSAHVNQALGRTPLSRAPAEANCSPGKPPGIKELQEAGCRFCCEPLQRDWRQPRHSCGAGRQWSAIQVARLLEAAGLPFQRNRRRRRGVTQNYWTRDSVAASPTVSRPDRRTLSEARRAGPQGLPLRPRSKCSSRCREYRYGILQGFSIISERRAGIRGVVAHDSNVSSARCDVFQQDHVTGM